MAVFLVLALKNKCTAGHGGNTDGNRDPEGFMGDVIFILRSTKFNI